ncbi:flagellar hook-associated protein FlgL [Paracoccaceae bacterium]|nr:flagellar hook-associated protein FlgL [Paracoccaceae bacterium]
MTIGTTRFFGNNSELFSKLNTDLQSLQTQAGTGKAELKLANNIEDISKLSAAEEKKSETNQLLSNSQRAQTDLEVMDVAFERLQNLLVRLQELAVESANDTLTPDERERFVVEASMIKSELIDVANQKDNFDNSLFGGVSGAGKPFEQDASGKVNYSGSSLAKEIQVTPGLAVRQNFSGLEVFQKINGSDSDFSVFEVVDDLIESLKIDLNSGKSSNLFKDAQTTTIKFPNTGPQSHIALTIEAGEKTINLSQDIFGNDFSALASSINNSTLETGLTATFSGDNELVLTGNINQLTISDFVYTGDAAADPNIAVINPDDGTTTEYIAQKNLQSEIIRSKIRDAFEHFATKRSEVSAAARRAQSAEVSAQDILLVLEEDISEIKDADLASILTQLEFLMTQKDAAQATFTRVTSKSLFDFLS